MKVNSYQFWVVGNRTVRKVTLPTDKIISELGMQYNLKTVAIIPRNISNKRMPRENSPTNKKGKKGGNNEYGKYCDIKEGKIMATLVEIQRRLEEIKDMGYIPTKRINRSWPYF